MTIHLKKLLNESGIKIDLADGLDPLITAITNDSRQVKAGSLFIAYPGLKVDGRDYIENAIKSCAAAVLYDPLGLTKPLPKLDNIPLIPIPKLNQSQGIIASRFYDNPSHKMTVIGVTGTSGKTSCTHFIAQALQAHNIKCGVIGTLGSGFPPNLSHHINNLTTPDPIELQKNLFELQQQGAQVIAMEVASHALDQYRVNGVQFKIAVFTQLSRDHLDYHGSMEAYAHAKKKLFQQPGLRYGIVNGDDALGQDILRTYSNSMEMIGYSTQMNPLDNVPNIMAKKIKPLALGYEITLETPWGQGTLVTSLLGRFNVSNLLAVIGTLGVMNIPFTEILKAVAALKNVKGRMQFLQRKGCPNVVIDYSHKPDALQQVLTVLREHCTGKLWCVFGCGGDRDRGKRPQMAAIAEQRSDHIVVTSDNPRSEDPQKIIENILAGFSQKNSVKSIVDRAAAIEYAMQQAAEDDLILVAGKGHEEYQIIGENKFHFSDYDEVEKQFFIRSSKRK